MGLRLFCFYYDEAHQSYYGTSFWAMKEIEGTTEFLRRKSNLYKDEHGKTKMQIVVKGLHQGFRRHPIGAGSNLSAFSYFTTKKGCFTTLESDIDCFFPI